MKDAPEVEVVIEIPRGSFLKRGSTGHVDFILGDRAPSDMHLAACRETILEGTSDSRRRGQGVSLMSEYWP